MNLSRFLNECVSNIGDNEMQKKLAKIVRFKGMKYFGDICTMNRVTAYPVVLRSFEEDSRIGLWRFLTLSLLGLLFGSH